MDVSKRSLQLLQVLMVLFLLGTTAVTAQNPLERRVTLSSKQSRVKEILQEIEKKAHLSFSYNPEQIPDEKMVEAVYENKPVRFILDRIFKGWVDYRAKGNYIILHPSKKPPVPEPQFQKIRISGYVLDDGNGTYLNGVSIYDTLSFYSTISDANGHFEIELGENSNALFLMVKKQDYRDTAYFIQRDGFQSVELRLKPKIVDIPVVLSDTIGIESTQTGDSLTTIDTDVYNWKEEVKQDYKRIRGMLSEHLRFNAENINDTFHRKFQFSFVPGIGTNGFLGGNVVNDFSVNLLGGYSKGVNRMEVGAIFNLDEGDVRYFQGAGIFNAVGGDVTGFQGAGIFNVTEGNIQGAQAAGIFNVLEGNTTGFQGAGIFNVSGGNILGAQGAGIFNVTVGNIRGAQAAGIFNISTGHIHGAQAAGIFNISDSTLYGAQAAGIFNVHASRLDGVQVAGIWNAAEEIHGFQIAGIVNGATKVYGHQLGLFNFADSVSGLQIGLLSFSKHGYHKWEIGADELFYTRTALRTGGYRFHNIIQMGMDPRTSADPLWFVGYGVGTSFPLRRSYFDIDLTASQIAKGIPDYRLSTLSQLYMGMDFYLAKKVSVAAGLTLNAFFVDVNHPDFSESFNPIHRAVFMNEALGNSSIYRIQSWMGAKVALRFF
ncbi:MAG: peptidase associated/transthyretin-like domain-containing protein [Bacteroidia bacterium]